MELIGAILGWLHRNEEPIKALSVLAAVVGGLAAAFWALFQYRDARKWKKAELAQKILSEIFSDPLCVAAMRMVDWDRGFAPSPGERKVRIARSDVVVALRTTDAVFSQKEAFIRDCFDALLDALQRLQHYLSTELLDFEDVEYPLRYTVEELTAPEIRAALEGYIEKYKFDYATAFLERYPFWKDRKDRWRPLCTENPDAAPDAAPSWPST